MSQNVDNHTGTKTTESLDALLERLGPNGQKLLTADEITTIKETGEVTIGKRTIVFGTSSSEDDLNIGDVVTANGLGTLPEGVYWIYFGKDSSGNKLITTSKPLDGDDKATFNYTAQNWLTYDIKPGETGYNETTASNNINKACAEIYAKYGGTVGTARSITLEDINRVTGFTEPNFRTYTFGTEKDYDNNKVDYYYPSLSGASNTSYPYFIKATGTSDSKEFKCDAYCYYKDGDGYSANWEGEDKDWSTEDTTLATPENMKYVIGDDSDYYYWVGSRSVGVYRRVAEFYVASVGFGAVNTQDNHVCDSYSGYVEDNGSTGSVPVRPVISLDSGVSLAKK